MTKTFSTPLQDVLVLSYMLDYIFVNQNLIQLRKIFDNQKLQLIFHFEIDFYAFKTDFEADFPALCNFLPVSNILVLLMGAL